MTLVLRYAARSDVGLVRSNNEDSVYAGARLLALADGMGGHAAGEVASQLVIAALAHLDDDEPGGDLLAKLDAAVHAGNSAIAAQVEMEPDLEGMGTTLTAILFAGNRLGLVHIGDSRGYLLRDGELTQITKDDTFVQTLVDEGRITREEAHSHPQRSLIMRALTGHEVEPTLTMREVRIGDRYLLCSDGLSDPVSDETILDALKIPDVTESADRLIELALRGGGPDNVTVVVADVVDYDYGPTQPIIAGAVSGDSDYQDHSPGPTPPRAGPRPSTRAQMWSNAFCRKSMTFTRPQRSRRRMRDRCGVRRVAGARGAGDRPNRHPQLLLRRRNTTARCPSCKASRCPSWACRCISPISQGCLNSRNQLSVIRYGQAGSNRDCQPMKLSDLAQSARAQVAAGLPAGTLEQANAQLRRLSTESLLPLCPPARAQSPADLDAARTAPRPASQQNPAPVPRTAAGKSLTDTGRAHLTTLSPPPPQPGTDCRTPT